MFLKLTFPKLKRLKLRLASPAHLRHGFSQHSLPLALPAQRCRLLRGMGMANPLTLFRRGLALLAIPAKHLAPPVIGVARLWILTMLSR
jgi:hypothetical protein